MAESQDAARAVETLPWRFYLLLAFATVEPLFPNGAIGFIVKFFIGNLKVSINKQ